VPLELLASAKTKSIRHTFGFYFLFICLGLDMAIGGPALPALATQTGSRLGQIGLLFLAGSTGYTLGAFISGRIFDRLRGHPVMGIAQLFVAALLVYSILRENWSKGTVMIALVHFANKKIPVFPA